MTNPFSGKSLIELRDGVPNYTDPELNALCACVCDEEWVLTSVEHLPVFRKEHGDWGWWWKPNYTIDWREAGRLLVKYRLSLVPTSLEADIRFRWWYRHGIVHTPIHVNVYPRRAITEAAVSAELTKWIEK